MLFVCVLISELIRKMNISDLVSISVILLYIIPIVLYLITNNSIHITALLGVAGTTVLSETLKHQFIKEASPRPIGASDCNLLCNDGNRSGKPGMPSSHSAQAAFFSGYYIQLTDNIFIKLILIVYAISIMISRYIKRCHSIEQIIVGGILGLSLSWILVRQL